MEPVAAVCLIYQTRVTISTESLELLETMCTLQCVLRKMSMGGADALPAGAVFSMSGCSCLWRCQVPA